MSRRHAFSVPEISACVGLSLSCDSILPAVTASPAMKSSGLAVMPQEVLLKRLSWGLVRFDRSALRTIRIRSCSEVINAWLAAFMSKCNLVLHADMTLCTKLTDVGVQAIATHCRHLASIELALCRKLTDVGIQAIATHCRHLASIELDGCNLVSDQGDPPMCCIISTVRGGL